MPNEIQPMQPSALCIASDTPVQMVQQTGEKSVYANHVENLNVTIQTPTAAPQLVTQVQRFTAKFYNNEYYNLFVIGCELNFNNIQPFTLRADRALTEYMDDELKEKFSALSDEAQRQICTFPSIFANENNSYGHTDEEQILGFGYVCQIKKHRDAIKIYPQIVYLFKQQALNDALFDLDIYGSSSFNEFNRTHWSIKKIDLISELRELGFQI